VSDEQLFSEYVGRKIGGCRVARRIGGGGMGVVFEARHLALNKRVALKLLLPALAADRTFIKRFVSEARLAAQVEHPNVVQVMNVGQDGDVYFMVMQFIEGQSLRELTGRGAVEPRVAAQYVMQAARGLSAAHKCGIVHRDVKPENILIDREGVARVVDMGLSKSLTGEEAGMLTAPGTAMGTPNYISPEQATEARTVDARADVYSLGATFYHLLSGAPPFDGPSAISIMTKHITEPPTPLRECCPDVPAPLGRIVERMLAKSPDDRFQTMDQVIAALKGFLEETPTGAVETMPAAPAATEVVAPTARVVPEGREAAPQTLVRGGGRRWPFVVLGAAGTLGVVIALALMAAARDPGRKKLAAAQSFERAHPRAFRQARRKYEEVKEEFPGSRWYARATVAIQELDSRRLTESRREFDKVKVRAERMEKSGGWTEAAALWNSYAELKEFAGTGASGTAAARAREALAMAELERMRKRAESGFRNRNWAAVESIAARFPAGLADTRAGREAAELRTRARIGRRAQEAFRLLADPDQEALKKLGNYMDPGNPPGARRMGMAGLAIIRGVLKQAKRFNAAVDLPESVADGKALVPVRIDIVHPGPRGRREQKLEKLLWVEVKGEWYLGAKRKSGTRSGPRRPGHGMRRGPR